MHIFLKDWKYQGQYYVKNISKCGPITFTKAVLCTLHAKPFKTRMSFFFKAYYISCYITENKTFLSMFQLSLFIWRSKGCNDILWYNISGCKNVAICIVELIFYPIGWATNMQPTLDLSHVCIHCIHRNGLSWDN